MTRKAYCAKASEKHLKGIGDKKTPKLVHCRADSKSKYRKPATLGVTLRKRKRS